MHSQGESAPPLHLPDPGGDVLEGAVEGGPGVGGGARQPRHLAGGGLGLGAGGLLVGRHPLLQDMSFTVNVVIPAVATNPVLFDHRSYHGLCIHTLSVSSIKNCSFQPGRRTFWPFWQALRQ